MVFKNDMVIAQHLEDERLVLTKEGGKSYTFHRSTMDDLQHVAAALCCHRWQYKRENPRGRWDIYVCENCGIRVFVSDEEDLVFHIRTSGAESIDKHSALLVAQSIYSHLDTADSQFVTVYAGEIMYDETNDVFYVEGH
jgi:hypothetical protein